MAGATFTNWLQVNALELIRDVLTIVGLVAVALTAVWQIARQRKNASDLQRENAREALRLRVFENLIQRIRAVSDAYIAASMYAFGILPALDASNRGLSAGHQPSPVKQRALVLLDLQDKAQTQLAELFVECESWSIAFPNLIVFRVGLSAANYDVRQAFPPLFSSLLRILPMDRTTGDPGKPIIVHPLPSQEAFSELEDLVQRYKASMDEIGCYIYDLTIEAQNNLLHGLFESRVPPRTPLDPRHKVLSTDPEISKVLIRYFETETPWGKNQAKINAAVMLELESEKKAPAGCNDERSATERPSGPK